MPKNSCFVVNVIMIFAESRNEMKPNKVIAGLGNPGSVQGHAPQHRLYGFAEPQDMPESRQGSSMPIV